MVASRCQTNAMDPQFDVRIRCPRFALLSHPGNQLTSRKALYCIRWPLWEMNERTLRRSRPKTSERSLARFVDLASANSASLRMYVSGNDTSLSH